MMEEYQVIGSKYAYHKLEASIYPDRVRIHDMLNDDTGLWIRLTKEEFDEKKLLIESEKTKIG
ncbi:MAG: hypothetical protein HRT74_06220 [Flavobacteriales bacterium]|nr:hypothetical protein [Flavobacteriales bacterium]